MHLDFIKLNGLGNDFVFIEDSDSSIELSAEQVSRICDRRFGVGADGVILVRPSTRPECAGYMHYINSDGTLAQMCGNGVRCFAKFLVDTGMVDGSSGELVVDTLSGPKPIAFDLDDQEKLASATVDMGAPVLEPAAVPVALEANAATDEGTPYVREAPLESPWGTFRFTCVSMGNPHAVCFVESWDELPETAFLEPERSLASLNVDLIGEFFESHEAFPEKSNIEFAEILEDGIAMRVFERGCRETLACGTGACATSVAATLTGRAGRENAVSLPGGELLIFWREDGHVMMTGPAAESFRGTVTI